MDQDLIPYFEGLSRQIAGLREEMNQRFEQVDRRFEQVDLRFEAAETMARQTLVLVEGLRHEVQLVAEGMIGYSSMLESYQRGVDAELVEFRRLVEPAYKGLDGRVRALEEWRDRQMGDVTDALRKLLGKPRREPV